MRASTPLKTEFPKYLRAFDARIVDAKYFDIGAKLYPEKNRKNIDKNIMGQAAYRAAKAGKNLVEGGYKELIKFW